MTTLRGYQELKSRNEKLRSSIRLTLLGAKPGVKEEITRLSEAESVRGNQFERAEMENALLRKQIDALLVISQQG